MTCEYDTKLLARFWAKVDKSGDCWLWTASTNADGYGTFYSDGNKLAHRVSWEIANGPIPDGLCVLHKCDVPACVRPEHLFTGTRTDNNSDRTVKHRSARGEANNGGRHNSKAKLTDANIILMRQRYTNEKITQRDLADEFGVSKTTVGYILLRKTWAHI